MELVYLWVEDYKNIHRKGFDFSPRFECEFKAVYKKTSDGNEILEENCVLEIKPKDHVENFFAENINITAIVGENGSGKSAVFEVLKLIMESFLSDDSNDHHEHLGNIHLVKANFIVLIKEKKTFYNIGNIKALNEKLINYNDITTEIKSELKNISFNLYDENTNPIEKIITYFEEIKNQKINFFTPNVVIFDFNGYEGIENSQDILNVIFDFEYKKIKEENQFLNIDISDTIDECLSKIDSESFNVEWSIPKPEVRDKLVSLKIIESNLSNSEFYTRMEFIKDSQKHYKLNYNKNDKELLFALSKFKVLNFYDASKKEIDRDYYIDLGMSYNSLSTGEQKFLTILLFLVEIITKNKKENKCSLICLDEPDNTLHPNWQKSIIHDIIEICRDAEPYIHICMTSHSPFILSDIPKENVIFLKDGKQVDVDIETFGANIHTLLSHGFFMNNGLMGEFAKGKINDVYYFLTDKESNVKTKEEAQNIINLIGEPLIKRQLEDVYNKKFEIKSKDEIIQELQNKIAELEKSKNDKN